MTLPNSRSIMSACEYAIDELKGVKKALGGIDQPNQELTWALGSIIVVLVSNLLKTMNEVIKDSSRSENPSARDDILAIRDRFNEFIETMINPL